MLEGKVRMTKPVWAEGINSEGWVMLFGPPAPTLKESTGASPVQSLLTVLTEKGEITAKKRLTPVKPPLLLREVRWKAQRADRAGLDYLDPPCSGCFSEPQFSLLLSQGLKL